MVLLLILLGAFSIVPSILGQTCTNGFVPFNGCAPCPQTCSGVVEACTESCKSCVCPNPKVVGPNGHCIEKSKCPATTVCASDEILYAKAAPCDKMCPNLFDAMRSCTDGEENVCRCKPGYVRTSTYACVPEEKCPQVCKAADEVLYYNLCHRSFPCGPAVTCKDFFAITMEPVYCTMACMLEALCACKLNHFKNDEGVCIPASQCPKPTCNTGETYYAPWDCAPFDQSCPNILNPKYFGQQDCAINVCRCSEGYFRNEDDVCVPDAECSKLCDGKHEVYYAANNCISCEPTCENWYRRNNICLVDVCLKCICKSGFVRKESVCVPIEECPPVCGSGERFYGRNECVPCCAKDQLCTRECISNVCDCQPGYERVDERTCAQNPSC